MEWVFTTFKMYIFVKIVLFTPLIYLWIAHKFCNK